MVSQYETMVPISKMQSNAGGPIRERLQPPTGKTHSTYILNSSLTNEHSFSYLRQYITDGQ